MRYKNWDLTHLTIGDNIEGEVIITCKKCKNHNMFGKETFCTCLPPEEEKRDIEISSFLMSIIATG